MPKILVITRQANQKLYSVTSSKHKDLGELKPLSGYEFPENYVLDALMLGREYDWVINIDEDALILNQDLLNNLMGDMEEGGFGFCGMPDGGVNRIREHSPYLPNVFFNIFQMRLVRKGLDQDYIDDFNPEPSDLGRCETLYSDWILKAPLPYRCDLFEPYYYIFIFLELNGIKFLPLTQNIQWNLWGKQVNQSNLTQEESNNLGSTLLMYKDRELCFHTWWGRFYGQDHFHTQRIDRDLDQILKGDL